MRVMPRSKSVAWPFAEQRNVAVFTHPDILSGDDWIHYVSHDEDDGSWQFLPESGAPPVEEARSSRSALSWC